MSTATEPKKPAATELVMLTIEEGSAVDDGDNPPARVAMLKNTNANQRNAMTTTPEATNKDETQEQSTEGFFTKLRKWAGVVGETVKGMYDGGGDMPRTTGQIIAANQFREKFWDARCALQESMSSILNCAAPDQVGPLMATSVGEFTGIVNDLSANMTPQKRADLMKIVGTLTGALEDKSAVKRRALVGAMETLEDFTFEPDFSPSASAVTPADANKEKPMEKNTQPGAITLEAVLAKLTPDERKVVDAELAAKAAAKAEVKPDPKDDPALKGASPEVLALLAKMNDKIDALSADKASTELSNKARRIARDVPGLDVDDVAAQLTDAMKAGGEKGVERTEKMLMGMAALARKGAKMQDTIGRARTLKGVSEPSTASDVITVKAHEMMKADPKLTFEGAYAKVMSTNKNLAGAAIRGQRLDD